MTSSYFTTFPIVRVATNLKQHINHIHWNSGMPYVKLYLYLSYIQNNQPFIVILPYDSYWKNENESVVGESWFFLPYSILLCLNDYFSK